MLVRETEDEARDVMRRAVEHCESMVAGTYEESPPELAAKLILDMIGLGEVSTREKERAQRMLVQYAGAKLVQITEV